MLSKNRLFFFSLILISFLSIVNTLFAGCASNQSYQEVTVTKEGVAFYFKYPSSYQDFYHDLDTDYGGIHLLHPINDIIEYKFAGQFDKELIIGTNKVTMWDSYRNAKEYVDFELNNAYELPDFHPVFELLERSPISVSNIWGELLVSKIAWHSTSPLGSEHLIINRSVFLDYKSIIWHIGLYSHIELADKAKVEFEHIIKSFKFLD